MGEKAKAAKLKAKSIKEKAKEKALAAEKKKAAKAKVKAKALAKKAKVSGAEAVASGGESSAKRAKVDTSKSTEELAHQVIDLAKNGKWTKVLEFLDLHRDITCSDLAKTASLSPSKGLVNLRPAMREYGILHQAAFLGSTKAIARLI